MNLSSFFFVLKTKFKPVCVTFLTNNQQNEKGREINFFFEKKKIVLCEQAFVVVAFVNGTTTQKHSTPKRNVDSTRIVCISVLSGFFFCVQFAAFCILNVFGFSSLNTIDLKTFSQLQIALKTTILLSRQRMKTTSQKIADHRFEE